MDDDFRVDIGRADEGRTFIRVVHLPTEKERIVLGLGEEQTNAVEARLIRELKAELGIEDPGKENA
jgi:hypothetical protein